MDDKNKKLMKPDDQIQALVQAAGATPDKTIICSCGTGREATNEFLLFKYYLGYKNVVLYEGRIYRVVFLPGQQDGDREESPVTKISFLCIAFRVEITYGFLITGKYPISSPGK